VPRVALRPRPLNLLRALGSDELDGRALAARYARATGDRISYMALYGTMRRLCDDGYATVRHDRDADGALRYFTVTEKGRALT
jgi:DNA-binding PadR family transcriptional regulator